MTISSYHEPIKDLLTKHGALGVNAIAKELDISVSTLQHYLTRQQSYFKKNEQRKWVLPEQYIEQETTNTSDSYVDVITNNIEGIALLFKTITTQFDTTLALMKQHKPMKQAVADKPRLTDKRLTELEEMTAKLREVFKKQKSNIPDEYLDLLMNYDHIGITLKHGEDFVSDILEGELFSMLSGNARELSTEVVQLLKENQRD